MPLYEYESVEDGERITMLRSMRDADLAVDDPAGRGRTFVRRQSTFAVGGSGSESSRSVKLPTRGGGCACGNPHGPCHS